MKMNGAILMMLRDKNINKPLTSNRIVEPVFKGLHKARQIVPINLVFVKRKRNKQIE